MEYPEDSSEREPLIDNLQKLGNMQRLDNVQTLPGEITSITCYSKADDTGVLTASGNEGMCYSPSASSHEQSYSCIGNDGKAPQDIEEKRLSQYEEICTRNNEPITGCSICSCNNMKLCDSTSSAHQYMFLVFICVLGVGDYFCVDEPAALQSHILEDLDISETQYMCFYSNIQWASIVSCLCGGFLIDKVFGNRIGITMFSLLVIFSHSLFAGGALMNSYWTMFAARGAYGLVEGPMAIANDNMAVKWFQSTNINFVFGLKTSMARVSSVVNINVMSSIYDYWSTMSHGHTSLGFALLTGVMVCFVSFIASVIVALLDKRADIIKYMGTKVDTSDPEKTIGMMDVKDFPVQYWLIALTTTVYYLALFPFIGLGQVFFIMKYNKDPSVADNINSMVYLMAGITMPIFGYLIDKFGRSLMWMFLGNILSVSSHMFLAFTFLQPYAATVSLGIGYSIFTATMWPMISYVIPLNHLGTAYGLMNAMTAVGQASVAYLAGYIVDNYGYLVLEVLFIASMSASLILGSCLYLIDSSRNGILNLSGKDRTARLELRKLKMNKETKQANEADQP